MKGELSLDYIGKFVLIMIAVLIGVGIIIYISGLIKVPCPWCKEEFPRYVKISVNDKKEQIGKIASLIDACYTNMKGKIDTETCYIVRNELGSFSITASELKNSLTGSLRDRVVFESDKYDRETLVIGYNGVEGKVYVGR